MRDQIKRILSEVAEGSANWTNRNRKVIGGVGATGVAGALSSEALASDQVADFYRKGIGLGRRAMGVGDAVEKVDAPEEPKLITPPMPPVMYGYRFPEPGCNPSEMHWEGLRKKQ